MKMISVREAAKAAGVSPRRIQQLVTAGRIPGAEKVAGVWLVPTGFTVAPGARRRPGKIAVAA